MSNVNIGLFGLSLPQQRSKSPSLSRPPNVWAMTPSSTPPPPLNSSNTSVSNSIISRPKSNCNLSVKIPPPYYDYQHLQQQQQQQQHLQFLAQSTASANAQISPPFPATTTTPTQVQPSNIPSGSINEEHIHVEELISQLRTRISSRKQLIQQLQNEIDNDESLLQKLATNKNKPSSISRPATPASTAVTQINSAGVIEESTHQVQVICRKWNRGECLKGSHCNYRHQCLKCLGAHTVAKCLQQTPQDASEDHDEACIKWNHKECPWGDMCHRKHNCVNCGGNHRALECQQQPQTGVSWVNHKFNDSICMNWNEGRCRMRDRCKREHKCTICGSSKHPSIKCDFEDPETGAVEKLQETCLNWNSCRCHMSNKQCKRLHQCSICGNPDHMAICCPVAECPEDLLKSGIDICWNWNVGGCDDSIYPSPNSLVIVGGNCKRLHCCSKCKSVNHSSQHCENSSETGVKTNVSNESQQLFYEPYRPKLAEICLNWNQNRCRLGDRCKRIHACSICNSPSHMAKNHH